MSNTPDHFRDTWAKFLADEERYLKIDAHLKSLCYLPRTFAYSRHIVQTIIEDICRLLNVRVDQSRSYPQKVKRFRMPDARQLSKLRELNFYGEIGQLRVELYSIAEDVGLIK